MDKVKETLTKILNTIKEKWGKLTKKIKIVIVSGISVVLVSAIVLTILLNNTGYAVLFSGTSKSETSEILEYVQNELGVTEIKAQADGKIMVKSDEVEGLRLKLASAGYPKSAFNYDIWDTGVSMFSTETEKREKQKQQLQNNLMATIGELEGVERVIVLLSIPKTKDYVINTSEQKTSASVVLHLKESVVLTPDSIEGIYNLVQTAVPDLDRDNITLADGTGKKLVPDFTPDPTAQNDADIALYYKRLGVQRDIQSTLNRDLESMFNGVYGKFNARVNVALNHDNEVEEIKTYSPSVEEDGTRGGMVSTEESKNAGGGLGVEGGQVGTTTNADISPDYPTLEGIEDGEYYYDQMKKIEYKVNEKKKQIEKNGYKIEKITASVIVDDTNMSEVERSDWEKLIALSIGTTAENVTIMAKPFMLDPNQDTPAVVINQQGSFIYIIISLGILLVALLVLALVTSGSKRRRHMKAQRAAIAAGSLAGGGRIGRVEQVEERKIELEPVHEEPDLPSLLDNVEAGREAALKREIKDFSKTNPEIVAQLIRTWMRDET